MNKFIKSVIYAMSILFTPLQISATTINSLPAFVFNQVNISDECDENVYSLIKEGVQFIYSDSKKARKSFISALDKVRQGSKINEYYYLWTQYGILKSSFAANTSDFVFGTKSDFLKVATNVINFLDNETDTGIFVFTDLGAFQMEVYRFAANGLVWYQHKETDNNLQLNELLTLINKAENYIRDEQDFYILDTKVRLLMKLHKQEKAFEIVKSVLHQVPEFTDFQDFHTNIAYQSWLKN